MPNISKAGPCLCGYDYGLTRGGGVSLTQLPSGQSVFFQPGDDSAAILAEIEALQEIDDAGTLAILADMALGDYFK